MGTDPELGNVQISASGQLIRKMNNMQEAGKNKDELDK